MNEDYKHKLNFILVLWVAFLTYWILLSDGIGLLYNLSVNNAVDFSYSKYNFRPEVVLAMKYAGLVSAAFVILNLWRKITYPIFLLSVYYFAFVIFKLIGSYGIWGFYFLPSLILYVAMFSKRPAALFNLIVLCYCLFYFFAGFAKIYPFWKASDWFNGYTIENLIASRMHESIFYCKMGINILEFPYWAIKLGIALSVVLELSAILIAFRYKLSRIIVPLLLCFHLFLFLTGTPGIIEY